MRIEEQIVNQETALGFLLDYSSRLLDCRDLDDIFDLAVHTSKERLHTRISSAFLFSKEGKLERRFIAGLSGAFPLEIYERGQGLVGRTAGTPEEFGKPHLAEDIEIDERIQGDPVVVGYVESYNQAVLAEHGFEERATSALAVPLNGHHRTFGVLRIVNKLDPESGRVSGKPFNDVDRDWLVMLARLTANAVVNVKRQNKLSMLANLQLLGEDNEKGFLDRVAKALTEESSSYSTPYAACLIHALDRKRDEMEILGHSRNFRLLKGFEGRREVRVKVGEGVCGEVFRSGQNKIVDNLVRNPGGFKFPEWLEFNGFVSLICILIRNRRGGPDFGTLQLFTKYEYKFDEDDIQYLESVAHQISTVLRALQEKKEQATLQRFLREVSSTDPGGPVVILNAALKELVQALGVELALLGLLSRGSESLFPVSHYGLEDEEVSEIAERAQRALREGCTNYSNAFKIFCSPDVAREICFPLISQGQAIGVLALGSYRVNAFEDSALSFVETFLSGVASKVQNNSLFLAALTLGTVRFDEVDEFSICEILAKKASDMMGTPVSCVWLRHRVDNRESLVLKGVYGTRIHDRRSFEMERSDGGLSWHSIVRAERCLSGARPESCYLGELHEFHEDIQLPTAGFRHPEFAQVNKLNSMISMPLILDGKVLGVINTYARRQCQFYDRSIYLFQNLALSGAMALGNAKLNQRLSQINEDILRKAQLANPGTVALSFSHDINLTMNHVNALLSSLVEIIPRHLREDNPGKIVIDSLTESTDYLQDLFRSLVRYAGGRPLRYSSVQLSEIIDFVQYICSVRLQTRRIAVKIELADIWIECDRGQLEQVFVNLFNNSIYAISKKRSKGGQIEVSARLLGESFVEIIFKDNGIGMSVEEQRHAFDLFFTTKGDDGTGFGLPICRKIVEDNHNGKIWIDSKAQDGAVIFIKLPRVQVKNNKEGLAL